MTRARQVIEWWPYDEHLEKNSFRFSKALHTVYTNILELIIHSLVNYKWQILESKFKRLGDFIKLRWPSLTCASLIALYKELQGSQPLKALFNDWCFSLKFLVIHFSTFQFELSISRFSLTFHLLWNMEGKFLLCVILVLQCMSVRGGLQKDIIVPGDGM